MDLARRIREAKRESNYKNCLGTAFFISSVLSYEGISDPLTVYEGVLKYLVPLRAPEMGAIVVLYRHGFTFENEAMHAGVVTSLNPGRVVHRNGVHGKLIVDDDLDRFKIYLGFDRRRYPGVRWSLKYYSSVPKDLADLL